jgi:hypothetical protein
VPEPPVDQLVVQPVRTRTLVVDHGQGGLEEPGVGLVQHDEHVGVGVSNDRPTRWVVEAEDGRGGPAAQDPPARVEAVGEGGKPKARRPLALGHRVDPEPALGDDAEGALAAHEQLGQVGTGGRSGPWPPVRITRPSASTTSRPMTMSSIFP